MANYTVEMVFKVTGDITPEEALFAVKENWYRADTMPRVDTEVGRYVKTTGSEGKTVKIPCSIRSSRKEVYEN